MTAATDFDLQTFLPYLLNEAAETQSLSFQRIYKGRYGMLRTEWRVLFHLGRNRTMTATEICRQSRLHKTKVSRAVRALEEKRFVSRSEFEPDRRVATLTLTPRGQEVFADLTARAGTFEADLRAGLSTEDLHHLRRLLLHLSG